MAQKPTHPNTLQSGNLNATGNSGARAAAGSKLAIAVYVSSVSGTTPSMALTVEWSPDGAAASFGTPEAGADSFAAITAAKSTSKVFDVKAPFYRVVWTVTGTTPVFNTLISAFQY